MRSACEWLVHPEAPGCLKSIAIIEKGGGFLPRLFSKRISAIDSTPAFREFGIFFTRESARGCTSKVMFFTPSELGSC